MCQDEFKVDDGVSDWESGLPAFADLTPLSQSLISAELASAFKISPEPTRTEVYVNRASQSTISSFLGAAAAHTCSAGSDFRLFGGHAVPDPDEGSDPKKKIRMMDPASGNFVDDQPASAKTLKSPRLVWTPKLHTRFVEVVAHLGLKNAVPKTIMQLMNVEGLTRENVASHLQKYRVYVKRVQGLSNKGLSQTDHLFACAPLPPQSFNESSCVGPSHGNAGIVNGSHASIGNANVSAVNNRVGIAIPMPPYPPPPQIMMMGTGYELAHLHNHYYQQQYNSMMQHQKDWAGNNMYNGYPHQATQNNNKC